MSYRNHYYLIPDLMKIADEKMYEDKRYKKEHMSSAAPSISYSSSRHFHSVSSEYLIEKLHTILSNHKDQRSYAFVTADIQDFRLIPTMTVYENVAFAMHVTNIGKKDIKERVNYMLELVHLEDKAKEYPDTLSGGEQQRVAVARALAHSPKLVIADEPTGNIDPELSLEMMQLLEHVSEMGGITVLVVTHEHELVRQFHQRVVTLKKGRIISDVPADPAAIQARPDHQTMQIDLDPALTEGKEAATV
jgi:ABC-type methionine transport system ATPase subunit